GGIAPGKRADLVVLDRHHPSLAAAQDDSLLDAWLFAADNAAIKTVYCRGVPVVQNGRHVARDVLSARYRRILAGLVGSALIVPSSDSRWRCCTPCSAASGTAQSPTGYPCAGSGTRPPS